MRKIALTLVVFAAALTSLAAAPSKASAAWRWRSGYYSAYPSYYYAPGPVYGAYYAPSYTSYYYTPAYTSYYYPPVTTTYYTPAYTSYYYTPGYTSNYLPGYQTYYYTPSYTSYYASPGGFFYP